MAGTPRTVTLAVLLLVVGGSPPAGASETWPSDHGFEIGFRTGVSLPVGDIESGWSLPLSRGVQFPLWLDLGYRMGPVVLGAYGQFAPGLYASGPGGCAYGSCFTYGWRAGVEITIHPFGRDRTVDPWFSFGFGYEWNTSKVKDGTANYQDTLQGWDFARYGLGVDFALTPSLRFGPFVHGTLSQFTNETSFPPGYLRWIQERAIHGWITVGVRLTTLL